MNKTIDMLNAILDFIEYKISQYKEVEDNFPSSKVITEKWIKKVNKAKAIVENMKKEAELLKDIY